MKTRPKVVRKHEAVKFSALKAGDCFMYDADTHLFIKTSDDRVSVRLSDGATFEQQDLDRLVIPVNSEVRWLYPSKK